MKIHELVVSRRKSHKRIGRGIGSGQGKTAGRGTKGQKSRSGGSIPAYFEGGQNPLVHRLPKQRGFKSKAQPVQIIHTNQLNQFKSGQTITPATLKDAGLIQSIQRPVKLLSRGELSTALTLELQLISRSALEQVKKAKGKVISKAPVAAAGKPAKK